MMRRFLLAATAALVPGLALAEANVGISGDLEKDYMKFYCVYESNLYSIGADMCSADGHVQVCAIDEKQSPRPVWKTDGQMCSASE
ncbi:hypothetical protein RB623_11265 [Mesorhizobium sp. LHD-90]|uniref:hypothetical protein n=1 Tax=Mesorhizobium sp. LHD-90 TaxID=3071414 RepID=UPI0027DFAA4F|nr:hypothetical protein [Mesorhizobium sp. LHD-90]MDQ6434624.1 hypothetical protein [Mesorhizobium sp. LHD-90]